MINLSSVPFAIHPCNSIFPDASFGYPDILQKSPVKSFSASVRTVIGFSLSFSSSRMNTQSIPLFSASLRFIVFPLTGSSSVIKNQISRSCIVPSSTISSAVSTLCFAVTTMFSATRNPVPVTF